jgi:hypothetical protein
MDLMDLGVLCLMWEERPVFNNTELNQHPTLPQLDVRLLRC